MAKFKVGDKVRVRSDLKAGKLYGEDFFTDLMEIYKGKSFTIDDAGFDVYWLECAEGFVFTDEMLEPAHPDQQIHISRDGDTVHAVIKENGKVVKRTKAVCAPSDTFDFELGARIAFDRLFENETKKEKVFSLEAYLRDILNDGLDNLSKRTLQVGWPMKCDGKTELEINNMGLSVADQWMVEP